MLQKTLLNIEGLGRQLDPDLDLWVTAKPYLERWMSEQIGWRGLVQHVRDEAPYWGTLLPQIPRLVHRFLNESANDRLRAVPAAADARKSPADRLAGRRSRWRSSPLPACCSISVLLSARPA